MVYMRTCFVKKNFFDFMKALGPLPGKQQYGPGKLILLSKFCPVKFFVITVNLSIILSEF